MVSKRIDLDAIFKSASLGMVNKSISQTLGGMRTGARRLLTPSDRSNHGYVFMTRPQLNLTSPNISRYRPFFPLMNKDPNSLSAWIRATLDPRWALVGNAGAKDARVGGPEYKGLVYSTQADVRSPFINVVSNALITMSGFPDIDVPTFTGDPNRIGASFQMIDGVDNLNMPVDITMVLKDMIGSPIYNLFRVLSIYPTQLYQGGLQRYPDFIVEDSFDYNVRIYKIVLSPDGEHIHSIASTYPGFIQGVAAGQRYDYNMSTPYEEDSTVSMRFTFSGVIYEDPVLIDDFNMTVRYANPAMKGKKSTMTKIPRELLEYFSYERVYPWIEKDSNKLEWWANTATYTRVKAMYDSLNTTTRA